MSESKKEKIKRVVAEAVKRKKRKETAGKVNIENVSAPKKHKPKKVKEHKGKKHDAAPVSIGAHGGRYIQEPSGHKRYVAEGNLAGKKRLKKSIHDELGKLVKQAEIEEFVKSFKKEKENERK